MGAKVINIDLEALKARLSWGDMSKIAKAAGICSQAVSKQLSGITKTIKPEVIDATLDLIEKKDKAIIKLNKRINK